MPVEEIFNEALLHLRFPILRGHRHYDLLKRVEVDDYATNDFMIKVILDGSKLDAAGQGRGDGMDKVAGWYRVVFSSMGLDLVTPGGGRQQLSTKRMIVGHFVNPVHGDWLDEASDDNVVAQATHYGLGQPSRVETMVDHDDVSDAIKGANLANGKAMVEHANAMYQNWLRARSMKVQVRPGARGIREPGTVSDMSAPMDELVSFEALWDSLVLNLKEHTGCEVVDTSDGLFAGVSWRPEMHLCKIRSETEFSRASGEMRLLQVAVADSGELALPAWSRQVKLVLHQGPLVAESWRMDEDGMHITDVVSARRLQEFLNAAVDAADAQLSGVVSPLPLIVDW